MEYVLRSLSQICPEAGQEPEITLDTIRSWLDAANARGCRETWLSQQCAT